MKIMYKILKNLGIEYLTLKLNYDFKLLDTLVMHDDVQLVVVEIEDSSYRLLSEEYFTHIPFILKYSNYLKI